MYEEKESGGRWDRPEQHRLLDRLSQVDVLVVWKPDRLSRSLKDLLLILKMIEEAGAGFRSLTEAIDTTIPAGRMMMHMLGSFAEFERAAIRERTQAGLSAARAQGRRGGHRPKLKPNNAPKSLPCWMLAGQPPMSAGCFESTAPPSAASRPPTALPQFKMFAACSICWPNFRIPCHWAKKSQARDSLSDPLVLPLAFHEAASSGRSSSRPLPAPPVTGELNDPDRADRMAFDT